MKTASYFFPVISVMAAAFAVLPAGIAAGQTPDAVMCIDHVDIGPDIVPGPGKPLIVSVRFTEAMDEDSRLTSELRIQGAPKLLLQKGRWHAGGYIWHFEPIRLTSAEGMAKLVLSGAKIRQGRQPMAQQTFPLCIGTRPLLDRLAGIRQWIVVNKTNLIFVEGYNQRTMLGLYEITGDGVYLERARRSAHRLLDLQKPQGYWQSGWQNDVYFADTGSALAMLINFYKYAAADERKRIDAALEKYLDLLLVRGDSTGKPFVHDEGSIGVGFHGDKDGSIKNDLNKPYTIATGLTGAQIFAAMYYLTGNERYRQIAIKACDWILDTMNINGKIPYIWDQCIENWEPKQADKEFIWNNYPYDTSTYVGEGFIAAWTYIDDEAFRSRLSNRVKPHIEWLLRTQNEDGSWAVKGSADQRRSPGVVNLLLWYYRNIYRDRRVAHAVQRYYLLLLDEERCKYLKIPGDMVSTALAGRALIDIIKPGVDCYRWKKK